MKYFLLLPTLIVSLHSCSQSAKTFDLFKLAKDQGITVYNRTMTLVDDGPRKGIQLSKEEGEGVAWINGLEFSDGIIEFEVRGENVKQHSFVGIAFHGVDNNTFDAIYLRPFQFLENDEVLRKRSIQYISLPDYTWRKLREELPGKYENDINPSPHPDSWVKMKVVIKGSTISTYINGSDKPSLVVEKRTKVGKGKIGLYTGDTSGGEFANLSITTTN